MHWSTMKTMVNTFIRNAIAGAGSKILFSKFYFNDLTNHKLLQIFSMEKSNVLPQKTSLKHDLSWQAIKRCTRESTRGRPLASEKEKKTTVCSVYRKGNMQKKWILCQIPNMVLCMDCVTPHHT